MKTFLYCFSLVASLSFHGISDRSHASSWSEESEVFVPDGPSVEAGVGAYSVTYSHNGKFAAVINETDETVSVYEVHSKRGRFELIQTVAAGISPAFVVYSPEDRYAYLTNFGNFGPEGSINVFSIDRKTGIWTLIQTVDGALVSSPYGLACSPCGKFLAVGNFSTGLPDSGFISMYHISDHSGKLKLISNKEHQSPEIMTFSPDGKYLAVTNYNSESVSVFKVNLKGHIHEITDQGSPFPVGTNPEGVAYKHDGKAVAIANASDGTVTFYQVNTKTGKFYDVQTYETGDSEPAELAYSNDDTLLAVGSFNNPGTATVFCVKNDKGEKTLIQSIPNLQGPFTFAFDPCNNKFAALSLFGDGTNPGAVQVFKVNDSACSSSE